MSRAGSRALLLRLAQRCRLAHEAALFSFPLANAFKTAIALQTQEGDAGGAEQNGHGWYLPPSVDHLAVRRRCGPPRKLTRVQSLRLSGLRWQGSREPPRPRRGARNRGARGGGCRGPGNGCGAACAPAALGSDDCAPATATLHHAGPAPPQGSIALRDPPEQLRGTNDV